MIEYYLGRILFALGVLLLLLLGLIWLVLNSLSIYIYTAPQSINQQSPKLLLQLADIYLSNMAASSEINNEYSSINPSLPFDIVSDILLLLPVKTLSRLKLVSKSWLSHISSPSFRSSHRRRSERNPLLLVATSESDDGGYRRNHFHVLDYYKKWGGGGGKTLVDRETTTDYYSPRVSSWFPRRLVFSCSLDLVCMYDPDDFYIRNPATRECEHMWYCGGHTHMIIITLRVGLFGFRPERN